MSNKSSDIKDLSKDKKANNSVKVKEKKENKLARKLKETGSELKKVSWPPFSKVLKQTGVVLAMVVIFTVVLFGIDKLLELIFNALV